MRVVLMSNDLVQLTFAIALLRDAGIGSVMLDANVSAIEGGIGALPRRLAVAARDEVEALRILREADGT